MTVARTIKQVRAAAKRATGYDFEFYRGDGYHYFVYNEERDGVTVRHETHSVYTMYLSHLTLETWVYEAGVFAAKLEEQ